MSAKTWGFSGWGTILPSDLSSQKQVHYLALKYQLLGDRLAFTHPTGAPGGRGLPSLSASGLTRAEMASPLRLGAPRDRGRGQGPALRVGASRDTSWISASLRVGEGAVGPAGSRPAGGGAPLRPCPFRDRPEVSGDRDTLRWVQGAAQGVVTGGYLGPPARGLARTPAARLRRRARAMAWMLDCLFASAFEPRPRRGEWGPPSRGAGVLGRGAAGGCRPGRAPWGLDRRPFASLPEGF